MAQNHNTNKAAVYAEPGSLKIEIKDLEIPKPAAGEVLLKLCGQVGGHEGVGKVIELGPGVTQPKIGSRVGIKWLADICGSCDACLEGDDNTCAKQKISGYYTPGTFQQYVVTSAKYATPIPDSLDSAEAAPILCAGLTVYTGLQKSNATHGDWIVISGAGGGLGHLAVQYAKRTMGLRVIGIDHGSKAELVKSCGAEIFLDYTKYDDIQLSAEVKKVTKGGRGANAAMVVNASNKSYEQALNFLKPLGTLVCIGMPEGEAAPIKSAHPARIASQQFRIIGSAIGNRQGAIEALDYAAQGLVKCEIKLEKLDNLSQVFEDMHKGQVQARIVIALP